MFWLPWVTCWEALSFVRTRLTYSASVWRPMCSLTSQAFRGGGREALASAAGSEGEGRAVLTQPRAVLWRPLVSYLEMSPNMGLRPTFLLE